MVTGSKLVLIPQSTVDTDTATTGDAFSLTPGSSNLILVTEVSDRTDGTYALEVEHSPDGVNWLSLGTVAGILANGIAITRITDSAFHLFRAILTSTVTTDGADVSCYISFTPNRL